MTREEEHASKDQNFGTEEQAGVSFDARAKDSGSMGGGASGPREMPTGGRAQQEADADTDPSRTAETEQTGGSGTGSNGSSNGSDHEARSSSQSQAPKDKGQEEIENYGSRREDKPDELLSPSSQIGRSAQSGGTPESGRHPDETAREGWKMPDQSDTPEDWPVPTTD